VGAAREYSFLGFARVARCVHVAVSRIVSARCE
jgi:hypothetical protein